MIDNIKIIAKNVNTKNFDFKNYKPYGTYGNKQRHKKYFYSKKSIEELNKPYPKKGFKKDYCIEVEFFENKKTNKSELTIKGSIRKWHYWNNSRMDLNLSNFTDCINKLALEIGVEESVIWNAKVTKLETGLTLKLKRKQSVIVNCIFRYKNFRKNTYDKFGVEFKGTNYDINFYDHLRRVFRQKGKSERIYKKLVKNNFLFRFEIQAHKVSGMKEIYSDKLNTVLKIKNNWKYIGENLIKTYNTVRFVNVTSPRIKTDISGGQLTELKNYLIYKGIENIGIENLRIISNTIKHRKRGDFLRDALTIYEEYLTKNNEDLKLVYGKMMEKKISILQR